MISWKPFGDIMQKRRCIEDLAPVDPLDQFCRQRMFVLAFTALDCRHIANRSDQVLINCIMMIHVELHTRDNTPELRNKGSEDARFIQQAQRVFRISPRSENGKK